MASLWGLAQASARVRASRDTKNGKLLRVKRDLYLLPETWQAMGEADFFRLANLIQTPSYVSLTTALSYQGLTTQVPSAVIESMNPVRSYEIPVQETRFRYYYCRSEFYFGFYREKDFFIAKPEKALLDALYLSSLGRYGLDASALDLKNINWKIFEGWAKKYSDRFRKFVKTWRHSYERT